MQRLPWFAPRLQPWRDKTLSLRNRHRVGSVASCPAFPRCFAQAWSKSSKTDDTPNRSRIPCWTRKSWFSTAPATPRSSGLVDRCESGRGSRISRRTRSEARTWVRSECSVERPARAVGCNTCEIYGDTAGQRGSRSRTRSTTLAFWSASFGTLSRTVNIFSTSRGNTRGSCSWNFSRIFWRMFLLERPLPAPGAWDRGDGIDGSILRLSNRCLLDNFWFLDYPNLLCFSRQRSTTCGSSTISKIGEKGKDI